MLSTSVLTLPLPLAAASRMSMRFHRAALLRQELAGLVPGKGDAVEGARRLAGALHVEAEAGDDPRLRHGVGQHLVVVLHRRRELLDGLGIGEGHQVAHHAADRRPVRLGEYRVEGHDDGALLGELVDQPRHDRARPRPLAVFLEAPPRRCRRCAPASPDCRCAARCAGSRRRQSREDAVTAAGSVKRSGEGAQQHDEGHEHRRSRRIDAAQQPTHAPVTLCSPNELHFTEDDARAK